MKNKKIIAIIVLIGIIISLIVLNTKNKNIEGQETRKEQLGETTQDNAYVSMETHLSELSAKQQELDNVQNTADKATVTASQILKDYTAYKDGQLITGTMANNGALNGALKAGESFTIPAGYTSGGKVTANSLASQTSATATAAQILKNYTAYKNGQLITGTMTNRGAWTNTPTGSGKVTIPAGYHNGSGYVNTATVYNNGVNAGKASLKTASQLANGSSYTVASNYVGKQAIVITSCWSKTASNQASMTENLGGLTIASQFAGQTNGWTITKIYIGTLKSGTISVTNTCTENYSGAQVTVLLLQ